MVWLAEGYWKLVGACAGFYVCWFICVLLDHMPCLPSPSRHVGITPASRQQEPPSSLPLLTLDMMHHRVLTGDNADNPWEIKTVRGGQHDWDLGFFLHAATTHDSVNTRDTHKFAQEDLDVQTAQRGEKLSLFWRWDETLMILRGNWAGCSGDIL